MREREERVCAHCGETIDHLEYSCWETRNCYGTCDVDFGNTSEDDSEHQDSGGWDYKCPECHESVSEEDLLELPPPEPENVFNQSQQSTWVV